MIELSEDMKRRIITTIFIVTFMALSAMGIHAFASGALDFEEESSSQDFEGEEITSVVEQEVPLEIADEDLPDSDTLLNGYLEQAAMEVAGEEADLGLGEESLTEIYTAGYDTYVSADADAAALTAIDAGTTGTKTLTEAELRLYSLIKAKVDAVAQGGQALTQFTFSFGDIFDDVLSYTSEDLGVESLGSVDSNGNASVSEDTNKMITEKLIDFNLVMSSLMQDYPFEFYWYDKTSENNSIAYNTIYWPQYTDDNIASISINTDASKLTVSLCVSKDYSYTNETDTYQANTARTGAAYSAAQKASKVVSSNAGSTDAATLDNYRSWICDNVDYDNSAADNLTNTAYGDPWQLINVFDGDSSTNVVCEGYSKAFKYLCDLTEFKNSGIGCYVVTGSMMGGTGEGAHMWNVVTMDDGANYLVDVTNCDSGSIGYPDSLFLRGYTTSQTPYEAYVVNVSTTPITYTYDNDMGQLYSTGILSIAGEDYSWSGSSSSETGDDDSGNGSGESGDDDSGNNYSEVVVDSSGITESNISAGAVNGLSLERANSSTSGDTSSDTGTSANDSSSSSDSNSSTTSSDTSSSSSSGSNTSNSSATSGSDTTSSGSSSSSSSTSSSDIDTDDEDETEDSTTGSHYYDYVYGRGQYTRSVWPDQSASIISYPVGLGGLFRYGSTSSYSGRTYYDYDDDDYDDDDDDDDDDYDIIAGTGNSRAAYEINGNSTVRYEKYLAEDYEGTVVIPARIKISGSYYKVNSIATDAFNGNGRVKLVVIGKNVKRINPKAFRKAPNITKLVIRSKGLTKNKTKNALKGSKIKEIAVPKTMLDKYRNIFTDPASGGSSAIYVYTAVDGNNQ